jgi:hypothetical protein
MARAAADRYISTHREGGVKVRYGGPLLFPIAIRMLYFAIGSIAPLASFFPRFGAVSWTRAFST